jgi:nicotinate phosphoribosyltransferase
MATESPLRTDLYQLNMAASYLARGMSAPATFSLSVRSLPPGRGYLVAAGIESCLEFLEELHFSDEDLSYLSSIGFTPETLEAFASLRFTGEVDAVHEGRVLFENEPILEVTAPIAEAQLVETFLLNQIVFQTNVASKAARCTVAANGEIDLVEFGMRRAHGLDAATLAARSSAIAGFVATSDVEAARRFGLVAAGTMAHSYIESFPDESLAFASFAEDLPHRATFLVDTYRTESGVRHAIEVIRAQHLEHSAAIRIDSGDLVAESFAARAQLDAAGLPEVRIMVSGALDEHDLAAFVAAGAPIDAAGIGTKLVVAADAPFLDAAYKLVAYEGRPVAKLSSGKASLPGAKQIWRRGGFEDLLTLRAEADLAGAEPLLVPAMRSGRRVLPFPRAEAVHLAAERLRADLSALPDETARLQDPRPVEISLSARLLDLTDAVHTELAAQAASTSDPNAEGQRVAGIQP